METSAGAGARHMLINNNISSSMAPYIASPTCLPDPWQCQAEGWGGEPIGEMTGLLSPASVWATFTGKDCPVEAFRRMMTPSISFGTTNANAAELLEMLAFTWNQQDQNSDMRWQESIDTCNNHGESMDGKEMIISNNKTVHGGNPALKPPCTSLQLEDQNQDARHQEKCVQVDAITQMQGLTDIPLLDDDYEDALEDPESPELPLESVVHPEDLVQPLCIPLNASELSLHSAPGHKTEHSVGWGISPPLMCSLSRQRMSAKAAAPKQKLVDYSKSPPIEQIVKLLGISGRWRKYGRKMMRDCPYPAHYYKCTIRGCGAKRKVWYNHEGELQVFGKGDDHSHRSLSTAKAAAQKEDNITLHDHVTSGQAKGKKSAGKQSASSAAESASRKRKQAKGSSRTVKPKPNAWPRQPNPSWRFRDAGIKMENAPRESKQASAHVDEGAVCAMKGQEASNGPRKSLGLDVLEGGHGASTSSLTEEVAGGYSGCSVMPQSKSPGELDEMTLLREELAKEVAEGGFDPESLFFAPFMLRQHSWRRVGRL